MLTLTMIPIIALLIMVSVQVYDTTAEASRSRETRDALAYSTQVYRCPEQNGCHFADDIFECILSGEEAWISSEILLKFARNVLYCYRVVSGNAQFTISQHRFM